MKAVLKAELRIWAQYIFIAMLAGYIVFGLSIGRIPGINLKEAWRSYEPLQRQWLFVVTALGALRLLLVLLFYKLRRGRD